MSTTASFRKNRWKPMPASAAIEGGSETASSTTRDINPAASGELKSRQRSIFSFAETLTATLVVFGLFFVQAIVVARILGPAGRGEFGAILYFPRDLLLYVGLWGGVELMTAWAARPQTNLRTLKRSALRLAILTGLGTGLVAFLLAAIVLTATQKAYLLPWCAIVALYLPLEHLQLTVSAVDRGSGRFRRYNRDRILFAASFPLVAAVVFGCGWNQWIPLSSLQLLCCLWVGARLLGVLPTVYDLMRSEPEIRGPMSAESTTNAKMETNRQTIPALLAQGSSYAWSVLANELFERLDLLLIIVFASLEQAGQYFVSLPIATLLVLVPNTVSLFAFNWGAQPNKTLSWPRVTALFAGLIVVQSVSCVALLLALPWLIESFYGLDFQLAIAFSQWLLPIAIIRGLVQVVDGFAKGSGIVGWTIGARLSSLVLALIVALVGYSKFGLFSIPLGMGAGQVLSLIMIGWGCARELVRRQRSAADLGRAP